MKKFLLLATVIVGSCLTSCTNKIALPEQEATLDALMDGTIVVLSFQLNGEDFYVPFVRVGDTYQLLYEDLTRAGEPELSEEDCDITMEHDKTNSILKFYVREKKTSDLVLTAIFDIKQSTLEVIPGNSKYEVTNTKIAVSGIEIAKLLNGHSGTLADALVKGSEVVISVKFYGQATVFTFINEGHFTCSITGRDAEEFKGSSLKLDGSTLIFSAKNWYDSDSNLKIHFYPEKNTYKYMTVRHDAYDSHTISVNGIDITSKLTKEDL
jgi:hypothetical protein